MVDGQLQKAWMWDQLDVPAELKAWVSNNAPFADTIDTFPSLFGEPLGIAETFGRACVTIEANCQAMDCSQMDVWRNAGTAWKYLVVQSVANLNMVNLSERPISNLCLTHHGNRLYML